MSLTDVDQSPSAPDLSPLDPEVSSDRWLSWLNRAATPLLCLLLLGVGLATLYLGRGLTFRIDDWDAILYRPTFESLLWPHGGDHLNFLPFVLYKGLLEVFGAESYTPFLGVLLLSHLALTALLFVYISRRAGRGLALLSVVPFSVLGYGYLNLLWAWQVNYNGSVWFGIAALLLMSFRTRRADVLAAISLGIAILWDTNALPFIAGAGVIALSSADRRRRWWVPLPAVAVFGAWWLAWGQDYTLLNESGVALGERLRLAPEYVVEVASAAVGGFLGLGPGPDGHGSEGLGAAAAAIVLGLLIVRLWRRPLDDLPQFLGVAATAVAYWGILGMTRPTLSAPTTPYYVYVGAALVLLVAAEALRRPVLLNRQLVVIGSVLLAAAVLNFAELASRAQELRTNASIQRARLGAVELARDYVDDSYVPDIGVGDMPDGWAMGTASSYLGGVAKYGSDAFTPEELSAQPEYVQVNADMELARLEVHPSTPPDSTQAGTAPLDLEATTGGAAAAKGPCVVVRSDGSGVPLAVSFRSTSSTAVARWPGGNPLQLEAKRFADGFSAIGSLEPGAARAVEIRPDSWPGPWSVRLTVEAPRLSVCQ